MACSTESWIHARNATTMCPHPAITSCAECETPLCSSHIAECSECGRFLCRECATEHEAKHVHKTERAATMQHFYEEEANRLFPQGCKCHDDSGSCD